MPQPEAGSSVPVMFYAVAVAVFAAITVVITTYIDLERRDKERKLRPAFFVKISKSRAKKPRYSVNLQPFQ